MSLIFSPYLVKLVDYIPKLWAFIRVYVYDNWRLGPATTIMNKIKRDMPVKHNIHDMSTYICQCLFFITFFLPFMIPLLNILLVLSLYLFRLEERFFILNYHSLQRSIHFTSILSIYKVSLIGFLLLQVLNFSNSNIVMKFINLFSINTENIEIETNLLNFLLLIVRQLFVILTNFSVFKELGKNVLITVVDLGFIGVFGLASIWILGCMFGSTTFRNRVISKLVELEHKLSKREGSLKEQQQKIKQKTLDSVKRKLESNLSSRKVSEAILDSLRHKSTSQRLLMSYTSPLEQLTTRRQDTHTTDPLNLGKKTPA